MLMAVRVRRVNPRRLHTPQLRRKLRTHFLGIYLAAQEAHGECRVIVREDALLRHE